MRGYDDIDFPCEPSVRYGWLHLQSINYLNMRTKKTCIIVAYDISKANRRNRIVKLLDACGHRVNRSVYECMLSETQLIMLKHSLLRTIEPTEDSIVIYPICLNCFCKTEYLPRQTHAAKIVNLFY